MRLTCIIFLLNFLLFFNCKDIDEKKNVEKLEVNTTTVDIVKVKEKDSIIPVKAKHKKDTLAKYEYRKITDLKMFNDFKKVSAAVIDGDDNKAIVYIKKENLHILVLEKIINSNIEKVKYNLLDTVHYYSENNKTFSDLVKCKKENDSLINNIYAFYEYEDKEYFDEILKAWNIDLINNKFNSILSKNIKCPNISFGYED